MEHRKLERGTEQAVADEEQEGFPENSLLMHHCCFGKPCTTSPVPSFSMGTQRPHQQTLKDKSEKAQWGNSHGISLFCLLGRPGLPTGAFPQRIQKVALELQHRA